MHKIVRRNFIKHSAGFVVASALASAISFNKKYSPLLSFSTLGCPDWNFDTIVNFAAENNYNGIEFRGIQREMDLTKCPVFNSDENVQSSLQKLNDKRLKVVDLGSSCELHHKENDIRQKNLDEAKRFIDLAQKLNCAYIRVFPNDFPNDQTHEETIALIVGGLKYLGDYAADKT